MLRLLRPSDHKMTARNAVHSHLTCDSSSLYSVFLYPSLHYNDHFFLVHTYRTCTCLQETFSDRFTKTTVSSRHKAVLFKEGDLLTFCMVQRTVNRYTHHARKYKFFIQLDCEGSLCLPTRIKNICIWICNVHF